MRPEDPFATRRKATRRPGHDRLGVRDALLRAANAVWPQTTTSSGNAASITKYGSGTT